MSALAELITSERGVTRSTPNLDPDASERFVERIRAEYREMPGLSLTLAQAARVLGTDIRQSRRVLMKLLDEGLLVRDSRGAFRRRDVSARGESPANRARQSTSAADNQDTLDRPSPATAAQSQGNLLEAIGVERATCDRDVVVSMLVGESTTLRRSSRKR